jgi:glyoxylase-like metal-dependent hydrolase (beta-lactamase superfamily II)
VALVESDLRLLVDTGFDFEEHDEEANRKRNAEALVFALRLCGIAPEMVDAVFITHWHRDHFGNLDLFPRARRLVSLPLREALNGSEFQGVADGEELATGVKVVYTPGHTDHHASVLVTSRLAGLRTRIALAGDAVVSYSYFAQGRVWRYNADFYNAREALESMRRLAAMCDLIVPGHGAPFVICRPARQGASGRTGEAKARTTAE